MAIQDTLPRQSTKFLFDLHNFDEGRKEEPEEDLPPPPPPPPTFSEAELAAAKEQGYALGKRDGLAEAAASREKHVVSLLEKISQDFMILFAAEEDRIAVYEREAVNLSRAIFTHLFPTLDKAHGMAEIESMITGTFRAHKATAHILVEVHPDYVDSISALIGKSAARPPSSGTVTVTGNAEIGPSDCKIAWKDGGAVRNSGILAEKIHKLLEQTLADRALLRDNGMNDLLGSPQDQTNGE